MAVATGDVIPASTFNRTYGQQLKYGSRLTVSSNSASTTPVPVLRVDSIPIVNGESILIILEPFVINSSTAGDLLEVRLYVSTSGNATTSSTHHRSLAESALSASGAQRVVGASFVYDSATTGNLSVLVAFLRNAGSGTCNIGSTSSQLALRIRVINLGPTQSDTGTSL